MSNAAEFVLVHVLLVAGVLAHDVGTAGLPAADSHDAHHGRFLTMPRYMAHGRKSGLWYVLDTRFRRFVSEGTDQETAETEAERMNKGGGFE